MKTERNILIAFILNLLFSFFEFFGGVITGSIAIISDAVHDIGDAVSIGVSYFLEKKSKKQPDDKYTYGYMRYSIIGSVITTLILLCGSILVVFNAVMRIIEPTDINYNGMMIFAVIGVIVNFSAAFVTREGDSLNQKAVNLHMLEDVLGWIVVLVGAIVMRFTDFWLIDPLMSIAVAAFIFINAFKNLKSVLDLFLEKTPKGIDVNELKEHLLSVSGVSDVHHIHLWSMDGINNYATLHVVTDLPPEEIKPLVRLELSEHGINHVTIETEKNDESCGEQVCRVETEIGHHHHHHHRH
jgi:cobalt-zinc-cadmium efflux system protein